MKPGVNFSRRGFLRLLMLQSILLLAIKSLQKKSPSLIEFEDEYIVINGWVLLKSDIK